VLQQRELAAASPQAIYRSSFSSVTFDSQQHRRRERAARAASSPTSESKPPLRPLIVYDYCWARNCARNNFHRRHCDHICRLAEHYFCSFCSTGLQTFTRGARAASSSSLCTLLRRHSAPHAHAPHSNVRRPRFLRPLNLHCKFPFAPVNRIVRFEHSRLLYHPTTPAGAREYVFAV
jgi:hypothetical protein